MITETEKLIINATQGAVAVASGAFIDGGSFDALRSLAARLENELYYIDYKLHYMDPYQQFLLDWHMGKDINDQTQS